MTTSAEIREQQKQDMGIVDQEEKDRWNPSKQDVLDWLQEHEAVGLWNAELDNGNIGMFHVSGKTFLIRFYELDDQFQGWEVFTNLDPQDQLFASETLDKLAVYCKGE